METLENARNLVHSLRRRPLLSVFAILSILSATAVLGTADSQKETKLSARQVVAWLFTNAESLEELDFRDVAEAASGKTVHPLILENPTDKALVDRINEAAVKCIAQMNAADSPTKGLRRINEASRYFEEILLKELNHGDFACQFPLTAEGKQQRSGYPDLEILHKPTGEITYLDPKLFEESSRESTLRTFYFEPRQKTAKITKDARHLLLGFSHDGKDGNWKFLQHELVDLSKLKVRLKAEFDASNRDLYPKRVK